MQRLTRITLHNFGPFRGTHSIELDADVYAVVAKHEADEDRSNWIGKTTWLYALAPFLLFGIKPPSARTEDDWITDDEKEGYVEGMFDDAVRVKRWRKRGKSTQLEVQGTKAKKPLTKKPAQECIDKMLGMTKDDFFNSSFFKQKSMDKFITARPGDRMDIVSAWFNLGPLQSCEGNVRKRLNVLLDEDKAHRTRTETLKENIGDSYAHIGIDTDDEEMTAESLLTKLEDELKQNREVFKELTAGSSSLGEWMQNVEKADEYEELVQEGKQLAAECNRYDEKKIAKSIERLNAKSVEASATASIADDELARAKQLAESGFDGVCPVMHSDCPVREDVDEVVRDADDRIEELQKAATDAGVAAGNASKKVREKQQLLYQARDKLNQLETKRQRARKLLPAHKLIKKKGRPPSDEEARAKMEEAQQLIEQGVAAIERVEGAIADIARWEKEIASIEKKRKKLASKIQTHREALVIVGRNGAQRKRAERNLAEIEQDANALLGESGIDLAIDVVWSREASSGLATACEQCGAPFPRSAKVKSCEKCGEQRGPKTIDKLDIELSDHSGAAEDLAGVAFQLAAAAWLRRERGTGWSIAFIDEPFSHLDAAHVKRLSTHFAAMLNGRYGFEQSFVVAHDRGIMDALPGRVEIVGTDEGSRFGLETG